MSNSNKPHHPSRPPALILSLIVITLAAGAIGLSSAAVGLNAATVGLSSSAVGLPDKDKPPHTKSPPPSSLRCWQFGKLIFEETGVVPHQKVLEASHEWTRVQSRGAVYLFHSGETTCLFSQSALPLRQ